MDVKNLYIAMNVDKAAEIVNQMILKSDWNMKVNEEELGKYIAMNYSRNDTFTDGINDVLPIKLTNHTMRSADMNHIPTDNKDKAKIDNNEDDSEDENDEYENQNNASNNNNKNKNQEQ